MAALVPVVMVARAPAAMAAVAAAAMVAVGAAAMVARERVAADDQVAPVAGPPAGGPSPRIALFRAAKSAAFAPRSCRTSTTRMWGDCAAISLSAARSNPGARRAPAPAISAR